MNFKGKELLTRKQIIGVWQTLGLYDDEFCCPACKDVLEKINEKTYRCNNSYCKFEKITKLEKQQ